MIFYYLKKRFYLPLKKFINIKINLLCLSFILGIIFYLNSKWVLLIYISTLIILKINFTKITFALCIVFLSYFYTQHILNNYSLDPKSGTYTGQVAFEPVQQEFYKEVIIKVDGIEPYLLSKVEKHYPINLGNQLIFEGVITPIENKQNSDFDYKSFLLSKQISAEVKNLKILKKTEVVDIKNSLSKLKLNLEQTIQQSLPEPNSSLMNGIIFGDDSNLTENLQTNLKNSGIYHIISVSGFNVSIVFAFIYVIFLKIINRKIAILLSLCGVILFTVFIGLNNLPVLRATCMLLYVFIALYFGRKASTITGLIVASTVLLAYYPFYILNLSFLLSTFATLGILITSSFSFDIVKIWNLNLLDQFKTSLSAITSTSFITYFAFKNINLTGLITNFLVLPFIPIIMLFGMIMILLNKVNLEFALYLLKVSLGTLFNIFYSITDFISKNLLISSTNIFVIFALILFITFIDYFSFKKIYFTN